MNEKTAQKNNVQAAVGNKIVTYGADYQVILSHRCVNACGYCAFGHTPSPQMPSIKMIQHHYRIAKKQRADQITLTAGMNIDTFTEIGTALRFLGFHKYTDYLKALCEAILSRNRGKTNILPILDCCGGLSLADLCNLRSSCPVFRVLLRSVDDELQNKPAHMYSPMMTLSNSLKQLEVPGKLGIATQTGIYVGIGESRESWKLAAKCVSQLHEKYGHIALFDIIPFVPNPFSKMAMSVPPTDQMLIEAAQTIRHSLSASIPLGMELFDRPQLIKRMIEIGVTDLGDFRLGNNSVLYFVDPEETINEVRKLLADQNVTIKSRYDSILHFVHNRELPLKLLDSKAETDLSILLERIYKEKPQAE